jgi:hypothetical protein
MDINKNLRQIAYRIVEESMSRDPHSASVAKHMSGLDPDEQELVNERVKHVQAQILADLKDLWWEP